MKNEMWNDGIGMTYLLSNPILIVVVQYFRSKNKEIFYVLPCLGGRLKAEHDVTVSLKSFHAICRYLPLFFFIFFISYEEKDDIGLALSHHLIIPRCQIIKCLQSCYVVC